MFEGLWMPRGRRRSAASVGSETTTHERGAPPCAKPLILAAPRSARSAGGRAAVPVRLCSRHPGLGRAGRCRGLVALLDRRARRRPARRSSRRPLRPGARGGARPADRRGRCRLARLRRRAGALPRGHARLRSRPLGCRASEAGARADLVIERRSPQGVRLQVHGARRSAWPPVPSSPASWSTSTGPTGSTSGS